jgi:hypothetical protein
MSNNKQHIFSFLVRNTSSSSKKDSYPLKNVHIGLDDTEEAKKKHDSPDLLELFLCPCKGWPHLW